jgi:hypothetical protein
MKNYYLRLDESIRLGSVEHFYHFMWGYLLPACFVALRKDHSRTAASDVCFVLRSCGPLMDPLTRELFDELGFNFRIGDKHMLDADGGLDSVTVPRWDVWIEREWDFNDGALYASPPAHAETIEHVRFLRESLLNLLLTVPSKGYADTEHALLLLKRSPEPEYYKPGGAAEIPGYGVGRRALQSLEQGCDVLNAHGIPCTIFEPGRHRLREQVAEFHQCRGIICMRGAEIANLIWLKPRSKVVIFNPGETMHPKPPARALVTLFDLDYVEINVGSDFQPVMDAQLVMDLLLPDRRGNGGAQGKEHPINIEASPRS